MYETPTPVDFKARHPRFAAVADATIAAILDDAARSAPRSIPDGEWRDAVTYLAAHLAVEEGAGSEGAPGNVTGAVQKIKAGDVETTFDVSAARLTGDLGATYGGTVYGRRYLDILRRYSAGAVLVV